jgi:hypothetical protein
MFFNTVTKKVTEASSETVNLSYVTVLHCCLLQVKQTQLDREQVARDIADKLGYAPGVSYSEIAMKAADCGRMQLAIKVGFL